jgi:hypothetical protein
MEVKPEPTLKQMIFRLFKIIRWRLSSKKWIGKRIYIAGKMRAVIGETFETIHVKGLSHELKKDSRYL